MKIDPEFRNLMWPLRPDENDGLRDSITKEGCREPLVVWDEEDILLDGHHRLYICTELGKRFKTKRLPFPNRNEAMLWVVDNQHGRRNLNNWQKVCLALKRDPILKAVARERQGMRTDLLPDSGGSKDGRVDKQIAEYAGVGHGTVHKVRVLLRDGDEELLAKLAAGDLSIDYAYKTVTSGGFSDDWYSPVEVIEAARAVMGGIDLDPASCAKAQERVQARDDGYSDSYYSPEKGQDGLKLPWHGRIWLNPPYSKAKKFIDKLVDELYVTQNVTAAVVLLNTYHIAQPWFDKLWWLGVLCFPGHLRFLMPDGKKHRTEAGQVIVYLGSDPLIPMGVGRERFKTIFFDPKYGGGAIGYIVESTNPSYFLTAGRRALLDQAAAEAGLTFSDFMMRLVNASIGAVDAGFAPSEPRKFVLDGLRILRAPR